MEGSNNISKDFDSTGNLKTRLPYPEKKGNPESGPSASATTSWYQEHGREHRMDRDHSYKRVREHSHDRNSNANPGGAKGKESTIVYGASHHSLNRENFREEESRKRFREDEQQPPPPPPQQQPSTFQQLKQPAYACSTDAVYMDNNRRAALGTMPNQSYYGHFSGMNNPSRWNMNAPAAASSSAGMPVAPSMYMNQANPVARIPYPYMGMPGNSNLFGVMGTNNHGQYGMMGTNNHGQYGMMGTNNHGQYGMMGTNNHGQYGMMGTNNHGQYGMMGIDPNPMLDSRPIQMNTCMLYPPKPNAPIPTTREKPLGCKTVFVWGFPDNTTEEILLDIFERCGEILTIRMNNENFCHIRYASEACIDHAISLSGYFVKIDNEDDESNTGKLHVDYAQTDEDQYEYDCKQRLLRREACHGERLEQGHRDPQSVQPVNCCLRHLMIEKSKCKDEVKKAKTKLKKQNQEILLQFNEITKVFNAASSQRDNFTRMQQQDIEIWQRQTQELKNALVNEVLTDRIEDEMDLVSEDEEENFDADNYEAENFAAENSEEENFEGENSEGENSEGENSEGENSEEENSEGENSTEENDCEIIEINDPVTINAAAAEINKIKEENGSLKRQLEDMQKKFTKVEAEIKELRAKKLKKEEKKNDLGECSHERAGDRSSRKNSVENDTGLNLQQDTLPFTSPATSTSNNVVTVTAGEVLMIAYISIFLNVHPFGASIHYICSYLYALHYMVRSTDVENLMKKFPNVFKEMSTGIGARLMKKWFFCGKMPRN